MKLFILVFTFLGMCSIGHTSNNPNLKKNPNTYTITDAASFDCSNALKAVCPSGKYVRGKISTRGIILNIYGVSASQAKKCNDKKSCVLTTSYCTIDGDLVIAKSDAEKICTEMQKSI